MTQPELHLDDWRPVELAFDLERARAASCDRRGRSQAPAGVSEMAMLSREPHFGPFRMLIAITGKSESEEVSDVVEVDGAAMRYLGHETGGKR